MKTDWVCDPTKQTTSRGEQVFILITLKESVNTVHIKYNKKYMDSYFDMLCFSKVSSVSVVYLFLKGCILF